MSYSMDMSMEKPPKELLPKGWRRFQVVTCTDKEIKDGKEVELLSKAGNPMFKFIILDVETGYLDTVLAIATQGKRWVLKMLLSACGIAAGNDGVYSWDIPDIIGKEFMGMVKHEPNDYYDKAGNMVKAFQHKISAARPLTVEDLTPQQPILDTAEIESEEINQKEKDPSEINWEA